MRPWIWNLTCRDKKDYIDRTLLCASTHTGTGVAECLCASSRPRELNRPISAPRSIIDWLISLALFFARQKYGRSTSTCYRCGSIMVGFCSIRHITNKERTPIRGQTVCYMFISIIIFHFPPSLFEHFPFIPFHLRAGEWDERITRAWDAWLVWLCSSIIIQLFRCLRLVRPFFLGVDWKPSNYPSWTRAELNVPVPVHVCT